MGTKPVLYSDQHPKPAIEPSAWPSRLGARLLRESREALRPTIFFFVGFNFIVLTSNLLVARYLVGLTNFMLTTMAALVVGKAVLVANHLRLLRRYDRAPLIWPILFKTAVYWIVVFLARLLERLVHFVAVERQHPFEFVPYLVTTFSWHRFLAISLWILVLFLIYETATEFSSLFGRGEITRLFFSARPSELQLNRRQRVRELLRLSRIADQHTVSELADPSSHAHAELIQILRRIARPDSRTDAASISAS
jgi:hypothetical protein